MAENAVTGLCAWLEGQIDSFAVGELPLALAALPPRTGILIDLSAASFVSRAPLTRLRRLADTGVTVTIRGDEAAVTALADNGLNLGESLLLKPTAPS
jgi:hypothetical protein